jgi:pimeloyl-ACP methyl ester carboxylesterase
LARLAAIYGDIDIEQQLGGVERPVLVLAGRYDRTCTVPAAEAIAGGIPGAELRVFEESGHMMFIEEQAAYVAAVEAFLERRW